QLVCLTELAVEVAQQDQVIGQTELSAPGIVGPTRIDTDTEHSGVQLSKLLDLFSELGKLVRSPRRKVENVGQQDYGTTGQCVRQAERFRAGEGEVEIGRSIPDRQTGHSRRDYRTHPIFRILVGLQGR